MALFLALVVPLAVLALALGALFGWRWMFILAFALATFAVVWVLAHGLPGV